MATKTASPVTNDQLVSELWARDIQFLFAEDSLPNPQLESADLIQLLASSDEARLRMALIPLFLRHPELSSSRVPLPVREIIEIDGESHLEKDQIVYDKARTEYLEDLGYKVIRFTNNDVRYNANAVVGEIIRTVETQIEELGKMKDTPHPNHLPKEERELEKIS